MATGTGIRHADGLGEIRSRDAQAVIATVIHDHVVAPGHVALEALGARRPRLVMVVFRTLILRRLVACQADLAARRPQFQAVGLVTVAAGDAGLVHAALQE